MNKDIIKSLTFPRQKLAKSKKTDKWAKECIEAGINLTALYDNTRRSPKSKKIRNYNLYNGKFNKEDLEYVCNPFGLAQDGFDFPANMQYYPIATPIFDLLFGEETKRKFSYVVRAVNGDAISAKEDKRKEAVKFALQEQLASMIGPQEEGEEQPETPQQIDKYFKYEYQDMREQMAAHILTYLEKDLKLDQLFQRGWEDALLGGEEIYHLDVIANEPRARRCNPIEISALLPHNSDFLDEAEIIVEETYMTISEIVDYYYEDLTPSEIDDLERDDIGDKNAFGNQEFVLPDRHVIGSQDASSSVISQNNVWDSDGNIRVCHVTWKSKRKVGELTFTNELGIEQKTTVDESYKPGAEEKISWFWINEYWEGHQIGDDIHVKMKPKNLQFRRMDNISRCSSGYIGTVYNATNSQSVSLMDRLVPWIYLYIVMWYRTELLIATNQGKIALIDIALIPDGWDVEKWMYYATAMKFGFINSFNEGKKGQSTGQLTSNSVDRNKALDLETGTAIQGHISLLEYIETKLQELSGVTDQRMGAISSSEKVGNTQRAVTQSSHITEKWFQIHNWTKQRVLTTLVEVAKEAWGESSKKLQYVSDDLATSFFSVDGREFSDSEYGVFVSDASNDIEALQALKDLSHAAMQNDKMLLSQVADIYSSKSFADVKGKLKAAEDRIMAREDQINQQAQQGQMQIAQEEAKGIEAELKKDYYKIDRDNQTKIEVAEINSFRHQEDQDSNDNGIPDQLEIEKLKANVNFNTRKLDLEEKKLKQQAEQNKEDNKIKRQAAKQKPKKK